MNFLAFLLGVMGLAALAELWIKKCPFCGKKNWESDKNCRWCSDALTICPYCSAENWSYPNECKRCGKK